MSELADVKPGMEVIGADGVPVGRVAAVQDGRIRLEPADSGEGSHKGHVHYVPGGLLADVEGDLVRLSANASVAVLWEEEKDGKAIL